MKNIFLAVLAGGVVTAVIIFLTFFQSERNTAEMKVQDAEMAIEWQENKYIFVDVMNGIDNDIEGRSKILKKRNESLDGLKAEAEKAKVKRDRLDNSLDKATIGMEEAIEEHSLNLEGLKKKPKKETAQVSNPLTDDLAVQ